LHASEDGEALGLLHRPAQLHHADRAIRACCSREPRQTQLELLGWHARRQGPHGRHANSSSHTAAWSTFILVIEPITLPRNAPCEESIRRISKGDVHPADAPDDGVRALLSLAHLHAAEQRGRSHLHPWGLR
jgi:hypothetical protein